MTRIQSPHPLRVTFSGDSICVGQGVSIHAGWVARLAYQLDQLATANGCEIIVTNSSANGSTTRQALERMPYEVQSPGVDILVVQFGLNDYNHCETDAGMPRVIPLAFAANLKEIVMRDQKFGARRVFLNNNHPTTRDYEILPDTSITFEQSNRHYNQIIRDVATEMPEFVTLNDIESTFDRTTELDRTKLKLLLLDDGLHLSLEGHELYVAAIAQRIRATVENCISAGTT